MTARQKKAAEKIYRTLSSQDFVDFYGYVEIQDSSPMSQHIRGDENCPTKDEILEEIVTLFHL